MELEAAIDLHSKNSVLVATDSEDHVVLAKTLRIELEMIVTAMRSGTGEIRAVAIELTYNWYWPVDGLQDAGFDVRLRARRGALQTRAVCKTRAGVRQSRRGARPVRERCGHVAERDDGRIVQYSRRVLLLREALVLAPVHDGHGLRKPRLDRRQDGAVVEAARPFR